MAIQVVKMFGKTCLIHTKMVSLCVTWKLRSQFMAANEENLREILRRNPSLSPEQFQARDLENRRDSVLQRVESE